MLMLFAMRQKIRGVKAFIDSLRFRGIFLFWFFMILTFGAVFYATGTTTHILAYTKDEVARVGLFDSIYFSFVTAATIGYGDITPVGIGKILAVIEGMLGMLVYGMVISKLVSVKQEVILDEVYTLSFEENFDRLRSTLYLSRSDISKIVGRIESKAITKQELRDIPTVLHGLDSILNDILRIISNRNQKYSHYVKTVNESHLMIIFNSVHLAGEKVLEFLYALRDNGLSWKNEKMMKELTSIKDSLRVLVEPYAHNRDEQIKKRIGQIHEVAKDIEGFLTDVTVAP